MHRPAPRRSRRSTRLADFDYATPGAYFVTVVTESRRCLFGQVVDGVMCLSNAGQMVDRCCRDLSGSVPLAHVDALVVMPNHLHAIIFIADSGDVTLPQDASDAATRRFGGRQGGLSRVLQHLKTVTTVEYSRAVHALGWPSYKGRLWQRDYDERVIRNDSQLLARRQYILNNPLQWTLDEENPDLKCRRDLRRQGPRKRLQ